MFYAFHMVNVSSIWCIHHIASMGQRKILSPLPKSSPPGGRSVVNEIAHRVLVAQWIERSPGVRVRFPSNSRNMMNISSFTYQKKGLLV